VYNYFFFLDKHLFNFKLFPFFFLKILMFWKRIILSILKMY
jgi:hypothetical protein